MKTNSQSQRTDGWLDGRTDESDQIEWKQHQVNHRDFTLIATVHDYLNIQILFYLIM